MKRMLKLLGILAGLVLGTGCDHTTVGYLDVRNAGYRPDTVYFKAVLNPEYPEEARRIQFEIPWQTTPIEGVQGTLPISYQIRSIVCKQGQEEAIRQFRMIRKGVIELPWDHTVPRGDYIFNLQISNEGRSLAKDSLITIIIN